LHPRWGLTHFAPSPLIIDHVWFAQAVALAHSVIEELGVNVRASGIRPSVGPDGEWNPEVKDDFVRRLAQAGIARPDAPITIVDVAIGLLTVRDKLSARKDLRAGRGPVPTSPLRLSAGQRR